MTTKPINPIPKAKDMTTIPVEFKVDNVKVRNRQQSTIQAVEVLNTKQEDFEKFKKDVSRRIAESVQHFSYIDEVISCLSTPRPKVDDKGDIVKRSNGQYIPVVLKRPERKRCLRILRPLYEKLEEFKKASKPQETVTINYRKDDVIYLAERMMENINLNTIIPTEHVEKMYDYFEELKTKCEAKNESA